eukprot:CAMPEP_0197627374 /NCGR_PEP_ID=MMETSP1338-20131121/6010_1 /TAXON_ID=43686 ORGANISM="Pelagodinium beii, Strain RCC1491" /NCGR_SAMPLE_ID=MMETSP1338 /ASSEMBLY_ACC=CAM_ASM_000754 /LENGTH=116 /DNA_ID=CAMNT_0043198081 /DNA_START=57 /DNA_END=407 /DNA_ORIENTATION=-
MAEADIKLTTVSKDGEKLGKLIPEDGLKKEEGKSVIAGKYQIPAVKEPIELEVSGSSVKSKQTPFGDQPLIAEIEESEPKFGMHVTMGGFPMKAWMKKEDGKVVLAFSNGGRWSRL